MRVDRSSRFFSVGEPHPVLYLCLVSVCSFSSTALFVSISQVIEDRLQNDLLCVGWGVKLYSLTHSLRATSTDYDNSVVHLDIFSDLSYCKFE